MSEKEQRKVPEIRFKGFSDDWEQRKLSGVGTLNRGKSKHRPRNDPSLYGGRYPFVQTGDIAKAGLFLDGYHQTYNEKGVNQSKLWPKGTLLITIAANIAETSILNIEAAFPDSVIGFESNQVDMVFMRTTMDNSSNSLRRKAETSSQSNLNLAKLSELKIKLPTLKEQQHIGNFIKQLEIILTLHQQKYDQLTQLKKAYLDLMFPKNGETVPRVRFADYQDEWEQRELGEITDSYSGGTPQAGNSDYYGGNIPFIRSGEINNDQTELFVTEEGLKNSSAKLVEKGDILYALYGATSGEVGISRINGAINQAILAIRPIKNDDSYLIVQWLLKQKDAIIRTYLQGGQGNLSGSIVKKLIITLPKDKDEQAKIGSFFNQFDQAITLHQSKLDTLKQLKQAYLQKMFV